jgi:hypothetical protein
MYFNVTKCSSLLLSCLIPLSIFAKEVKPAGKLAYQKPLCFVENKGQVTDMNSHPRIDVLYKLSAPGMSLYLGNGQMHYQFRKSSRGDKAPSLQTYQMDVTLVGANPAARVVNADANEYFENYYTASAPAEGLTVHSYNKIIYKNVYPAIDWVVYVKEGKVEYDFVVNPGGDVRNIRLRYDGATALKLAANGSLTANTPMGAVTENHPISFETNTGKAIASNFVLRGQEVSFKTAPYSGSLTIDPTILWSRYIGGAAEDVVTSVKSTPAGVTVACGYTSSAGIAIGIGYQGANAGGTYDAFASVIDATGTVTWTTYIGGTGLDRANCIALTKGNDSIYVAGYTTSIGGISTPGVYQIPHSAGTNNDGFLEKISIGTGLRHWGTYYGGTGDDRINSVTVDNASNVYIGGVTGSTTGIASGGVYQSALSGATDAFVAKMGAAGGTRVWGTYFGGSAQEEAFGIATDPTGNIYVVGQTNSVTGIATGSAFQLTLNGTNDAFLAKISNAGTTRLWGTYFGGAGNEQANGVACDLTSGNIAVVGNTTSTTGIASPTAHQATYGGGVQDAFLIYLSGAGVPAWSTYYGGSSLDYGEEVCIDKSGTPIIAGGTFSSDNIASVMGNQTTIAGDYDAYVAKFLPNSQRLWGTYFGGALYDYAFGVSVDGLGRIVIGGHTTSTGLNTVVGGFAGGTYDGFVTKFQVDTFVTVNQPYLNTLVCAGSSFNVAYTVDSTFRTGNSFRVQLSDASGVFSSTSPIYIGLVTSSVSGTIPVTIPAGTPAGTGYRIRIVSTAPAVTSPDNFVDIEIAPSLTAPTASSNSPVCVGGILNLYTTTSYTVNSYSWTGPAGSGFSSSAQNPTVLSITGAYAGTYTVTVTHTGCPAATGTVDVVVNSFIPPTPTVTATSPACAGSAINFTATSGLGTTPVTYGWTGPGGFISTLQNPTIASASTANNGYYYVTDTLGGCPSAKDSVLISVLNVTPVSIMISVSPNDTVCAGTVLTFTTTTTNPGITPLYQWLNNGTPIVGAISDNWSSSTVASGSIISCILHSDVTCPSPATAVSNIIKVVVINDAPIAYITASPGTSVPVGATVTLNATVANGGVGALYQWQKNGIDIPGATNTTYVTSGITSADTYRMYVTSTMGCAVPATVASNSLTVHTNVGVSSIVGAVDNISLFPNPNTGSFSVKGDLGQATGDIRLEVVNTIGQVMYSTTLDGQNNILDHTINMPEAPAGVYILRLIVGDDTRLFRFAVVR